MNRSIEQAQSSLKELIERAARGEKVIITLDHKPAAELVSPVKARDKGGVAAIFGKWPGDEWDEKIEAALAELS
jgi:antitoxin (DNA-binding transcriptional repressor) of toxin-antitoxin stability system